MAKALIRAHSRLDFFAAVPRKPGLAVIFPPQPNQDTLFWKFDLNFTQHLRTFKFKHGKLGFRPDNATAHIGSSEALDFWVIYVPEEKLDSDATTLPAGATFTGSSQLSTRHHRQMILFWLYLLSHIGYPGLYVPQNRLYDISLDPKIDANWAFATDFK